jgi:hypothetical protein
VLPGSLGQMLRIFDGTVAYARGWLTSGPAEFRASIALLTAAREYQNQLGVDFSEVMPVLCDAYYEVARQTTILGNGLARAQEASDCASQLVKAETHYPASVPYRVALADAVRSHALVGLRGDARAQQQAEDEGLALTRLLTPSAETSEWMEPWAALVRSGEVLAEVGRPRLLDSLFVSQQLAMERLRSGNAPHGHDMALDVADALITVAELRESRQEFELAQDFIARGMRAGAPRAGSLSEVLYRIRSARLALGLRPDANGAAEAAQLLANLEESVPGAIVPDDFGTLIYTSARSQALLCKARNSKDSCNIAAGELRTAIGTLTDLGRSAQRVQLEKILNKLTKP